MLQIPLRSEALVLACLSADTVRLGFCSEQSLGIPQTLGEVYMLCVQCSICILRTCQAVHS